MLHTLPFPSPWALLFLKTPESEGFLSYTNKATDPGAKGRWVQVVIDLYSLKRPSTAEKSEELFISDFSCSIHLLLKNDNCYTLGNLEVKGNLLEVDIWGKILNYCFP